MGESSCTKYATGISANLRLITFLKQQLFLSSQISANYLHPVFRFVPPMVDFNEKQLEQGLQENKQVRTYKTLS